MSNTRKQSVRKSLRLWGWRAPSGNVYFAHYKKDAVGFASELGGTYLGEYIARPVKAKQPTKKKGAKR
jgi:hypothetical protein